MKRTRNNNQKKLLQDDEQPIRAKIRELSEGKMVTIVMMIVTIFALIGDDFRVWFFTNKADPYFYIGLIFSLFAFTTEILVNSCVIDEFKYSFFFWLDIVATCSIIIDIEWVMDYARLVTGGSPSSERVDVKPGTFAATNPTTQKIAKIVKSLRLIRLIRIIKLYKYAVQSSSELEEAKMREQQKASANA